MRHDGRIRRRLGVMLVRGPGDSRQNAQEAPQAEHGCKVSGDFGTNEGLGSLYSEKVLETSEELKTSDAILASHARSICMCLASNKSEATLAPGPSSEQTQLRRAVVVYAIFD